MAVEVLNYAKSPVVTPFSGYQKFVIAVLAFLQFTLVLDFMILSPLGAILMPELKITPAQFGTVVSAYAFSAGTAGLLAAGFADRFDRKKLLLFFYWGFLIGTLCCGLAPTYKTLLLARMVTGLFGGVIGSIIFAIVTDLFPFEQRGRVFGFIQTAFAASQVLGIPIGLSLANGWGWHAPFFVIVGLGIVAGLILHKYLKPVDAHLKIPHTNNPLVHLKQTLSRPQYLLAFGAAGLLSVGGYMLTPFSSAFTVNNLGLKIDQLPMLYLITGIFTIFTGPLVGRASDFLGKFRTFCFGTFLTILMVIIYTHLPPSHISIVVSVNTILFIGVFSRIIPFQALVSKIPSTADRGSFNAVSASLQQMAGGVASLLAGWIVVEGTNGQLLHMDWLGYSMSAVASVALVLTYLVHRKIPENI